jgi:lipopolysaccharide export system protein LptA
MKRTAQLLHIAPLHRWRWTVLSVSTVVSTLVGAVAVLMNSPSLAETLPPGQALTLRSDVQEANSVTGVITARGNVQINYPARQIQATSIQAQYYSREQRIILTGNVYVLQNGNSLRGENITYLINEGRFVALPDNGQQVESIYLVQDATPTPTPAAVAEPEPFNPKPEFKSPISPP